MQAGLSPHHNRRPGRGAVLGVVVVGSICFCCVIGERHTHAAPPEEVSTPETQHWPQWRGLSGTGVSEVADPPTAWSETKNVRWKKSLPGTGHSTPVISADRLYVTLAEPTGAAIEPVYSDAPGAHDNAPVTHRQRFAVLAIARNDGATLWRTDVHEAMPHEGGHFTASHASASPVTDGHHVVAFFGSNGLYCLSSEGKLLWQKSLGRMNTKHGHGEGASPVIHDGIVVVNWDHEGESFIVAYDVATGEERWRNARPEVTSWATPIVVVHANRAQLIASGTNRVRSYDLLTGAQIWQCGGLSHNVVASPVSAAGIVYVASSYETRAMLAIRLAGAVGDITDSSQVLWRRTRATPYVPSPLLYDDTLYFLRHYQGIMTRLQAESGTELPGPFRLGPIGDVYASPVAAAGRVYVTDLDGTTIVIQHGDIPRVLAINQLDDRFAASAALAERELYLRGRQFLYCLANDSSPIEE